MRRTKRRYIRIITERQSGDEHRQVNRDINREEQQEIGRRRGSNRGR